MEKNGSMQLIWHNQNQNQSCHSRHFPKSIKFLLSQQFTKLSDFKRGSGEFPSLFISLLLLTVVAVAASNHSMSVFKFFMSSAVQNLSNCTFLAIRLCLKLSWQFQLLQKTLMSRTIYHDVISTDLSAAPGPCWLPAFLARCNISLNYFQRASSQEVIGNWL